MGFRRRWTPPFAETVPEAEPPFTPGDWAALNAPVRIVHGADDLMVPVSHARRLSELMPGAELEIAEGEGHISVLARAADTLRWLAQAA